MRMKWIFILLSAVLMTSCQKDSRFKASVIELGLGFTAKNYCSCIYVSEMSEEFCKSYSALEQVSPKLTIDKEKKTATSSLFFLFKKTARFASEEEGCYLE